MSFIGWLISVLVTGLVIGALGRLAIPGPNPMSMGQTALVGIGGSFVGALVGAILRAGPALVFTLEVIGAAGIVWVLQRRTKA